MSKKPEFDWFDFIRRFTLGAAVGVAIGMFSWIRFGRDTGQGAWFYVVAAALGCGLLSGYYRDRFWGR